MKVLAWLAFPVIATILAMCWVGWVSSQRSHGRAHRRSGGAFASVDEFSRFRQALAAPGPRATPVRRTGLKGLLDRITGTKIAGQGS